MKYVLIAFMLLTNGEQVLYHKTFPDPRTCELAKAKAYEFFKTTPEVQQGVVVCTNTLQEVQEGIEA